jgi:hypothetical protein
MNRRTLPALLILVAAGLACAGPGTPDAAEVATQVVATQTALAPATAESAPAPETVTSPEPHATAPPVLRVVYTSGGNVWYLEEGSAALQLTSSGGAARVLISDDGARVAFIRLVDSAGHGELRAVNTDGTGETVLLSAAGLDALYPPVEATLGNDIAQMAFVPGSHLLLFNTYRIPEFIGYFKNDDVLRIDADTGVLTTLLAPGSGGDFAIAPDGSQLALVTATQAGLVNADGTNLRPSLITFPMVITYSEFLYYPIPVWAADSTAYGLALPPADPLGPSPVGTIWHVPADGTPASILGTVSSNLYFHLVASALAPSLDRVAFTRPTGTANVDDLFVAEATGAGESRLATGQVEWHGWAPDGGHYAYTLDGPFALQVGTYGGGAVAAGPGTHVRWISPTEFLYLIYGGGGATLHRGALDGSGSAVATLTGDPYSYDFVY